MLVVQNMCPLYFILTCFTCRLIGGSDYKLIYRHYATLYFVFCVDSSESELGILDLIQVTLLGSLIATLFDEELCEPSCCSCLFDSFLDLAYFPTRLGYRSVTFIL